MEISLFVRQPNATEYSKLGKIRVEALPRVDEYISADWEGGKKFFQVMAIHHPTMEGLVELYAVQGEPPWEAKRARAIGFGPSSR